jgi:broad specificity phosphatase PhoE
MICKLFVFRHAESTDNIHGILSGRRDPDLTPKGLSQIGELKSTLTSTTLSLTSTSSRVRNFAILTPS